jgi:hypothetical protein
VNYLEQWVLCLLIHLFITNSRFASKITQRGIRGVTLIVVDGSNVVHFSTKTMENFLFAALLKWIWPEPDSHPADTEVLSLVFNPWVLIISCLQAQWRALEPQHRSLTWPFPACEDDYIWDVALWSPVDIDQCFQGTYCLHHQGENLPSTVWCKGLILIDCVTVLQNRFSALSLAFRTDKLTLLSRHERQQRQRDQAERNMATEVVKLKAAVHVSMLLRKIVWHWTQWFK